jgi:hypothetical protein
MVTGCGVRDESSAAPTPTARRAISVISPGNKRPLTVTREQHFTQVRRERTQDRTDFQADSSEGRAEQGPVMVTVMLQGEAGRR